MNEQHAPEEHQHPAPTTSTDGPIELQGVPYNQRTDEEPDPKGRLTGDIGLLVAEYDSILDGISEGEEHDDDRAGRLCIQADWTAESAKTLVELARTYGSFVLRNALALSLAMGVEDGTSEM